MNYGIHTLGSKKFETLTQMLCSKMIGPGLNMFGGGPDGGREATFEGRANYPSELTQWEGYWVIQAKFKDVHLSDDANDFKWLRTTIQRELDKYATRKQPVRKPDNLIFFTNIVLTGSANSGGRDKANEMIQELKRRFEINNIAIIGYQDIVTLLNLYKDVRHSFIELYLPEDVFFKLIKQFVEAHNQDGHLALKEEAKINHSSFEHLISHLKEIPAQSPLLAQLNPFERFIYEYSDNDREVLEYCFFLSLLPFTKTWILAIELKLFNERFRMQMVRHLKKASANSDYSPSAHFFSWLIFKIEIQKQNLFNVPIARLYNDVIDCQDIDIDFREHSFSQLVKFYELSPQYRDEISLPNIFAIEEKIIAWKIFEQLFSENDSEASADVLATLWTLVDYPYRKAIIQSFEQYLNATGFQINSRDLPTNNITPEAIETNVYNYFCGFSKKVTPGPSEPFFSEEEDEVLSALAGAGPVDLEEIISVYVRWSNFPLSEAVDENINILVDFLVIDRNGSSIIEYHGRPFFQQLLQEVSFNANVSPVFSQMAIAVINKTYGDELFQLHNDFPDILFTERNVRLFPNSIIGALCDCESGNTLQSNDYTHFNLLFKFYELIEEEDRADLLQELKKKLTTHAVYSERLRLLMSLLNKEITKQQFINILTNRKN